MDSSPPTPPPAPKRRWTHGQAANRRRPRAPTPPSWRDPDRSRHTSCAAAAADQSRTPRLRLPIGIHRATDRRVGTYSHRTRRGRAPAPTTSRGPCRVRLGSIARLPSAPAMALHASDQPITRSPLVNQNQLGANPRRLDASDLPRRIAMHRGTLEKSRNLGNRDAHPNGIACGLARAGRFVRGGQAGQMRYAPATLVRAASRMRKCSSLRSWCMGSAITCVDSLSDTGQSCLSHFDSAGCLGNGLG